MKIVDLTKTLALVSSMLISSTSFAAGAEEASVPHKVAVGYKIGNGLGFLGAELLAAVGDHLTLGLQVNYLSTTVDGDDTATGYGVVPWVQFRFRQAGSSPYMSAGPLYLTMSLDEATASAYGGVLNGGWEWVWNSGFSIIVGWGVAYLGDVTATDGSETFTSEAGLLPNLEAAFRYYFL